MSSIPSDYEERVYAGVLGKIIGVYLGRPFEGWTYDRIMRELGEVDYYVNDRIAHHPPLVVTDDDISGTFTFLRALPDYGNDAGITAAQIGQTWLNYLIERQTILWWGGMGNSTEHTAYMRLKQGYTAPHSGSIALNGKVVAEQIGAQIFIDGWALVAPGNPALAAELARKAASVSHDGEAIYGAQVLAAMEAQAFVESDINALLDTGVSFVPPDSLIAQLIHDIRAWRAIDHDWHKTRRRIEDKYGYDKYGGNCHMIPNHAVIILALVYCEDAPGINPGRAFQRALTIGNTAGWDTDCNSGNIGCLMGIKTGLAGIDGGPVDWRGPVADRMYLPTADGGRCITDAAREARRIAQIGRALAGETRPTAVAHFDFELPGAVHGFHSHTPNVRVKNEAGHSASGARSLAIPFTTETRVTTATFIPHDAMKMQGYDLIASPTLYPGQTITATVSSDADAQVSLFVRAYGHNDELEVFSSAATVVPAKQNKTLEWTLTGIDGGSPIAEVGLDVRAEHGAGTLYLDTLNWDGVPNTVLTRPKHNGTLWQRAWVKACDDLGFNWGWVVRVCQDAGTGLLIQGVREWAGYTAQAAVVPHMAKRRSAVPWRVKPGQLLWRISTSSCRARCTASTAIRLTCG
ncbi:MAG: ADP-ribosylglycohydrolase family protein [Chloroflexi bacterium]|nr:ADP-ribosylglycohydrolase family protein [Chloroflexota bacterium]